MRLELRPVQVKLLTLPLILPMAWFLSAFGLVSPIVSALKGAVGFSIPSSVLSVSIVLLAAVLALTYERLFDFFKWSLVVYLIQAVFGVPFAVLGHYVTGFVVLFTGFIILLILGWVEESAGPDPSNDGIVVESLAEALTPLPVAFMFIAVLLGWSSFGSSPRAFLPFAFLVPLLIGAVVVLALLAEKHEEEPSGKRTYLVIRTAMKVGDSFSLDVREMSERSVTFDLSGGSPVHRPVLLKVPWEGSPPSV
uniref:hypothetical protein n=1 Tax=Thermococcus sp. TaxID=35749 RepID=UPI0026322090